MIAHRFQRFVESHSSAVMLMGAVLGLIFPFGAAIPSETIIACLACLIFNACFKLNAPIASSFRARNAIFLVVRFVLFPLALWGACRVTFPEYAAGLLLLALCPAATATPALAGLYRGNVTQAFTLTIASNLACVGLIPLLMHACGHGPLSIPTGPMLRTLVLCVFLPCALYVPARKCRTISAAVGRYDRFAAVLLVGMIAFVVLTKKRADILANPQAIVLPFAIVAVFFAAALFVGLCMRAPGPDRVTYVIASSLNNVALGAGLAFLYFDTKTVALFIAGEFGWCLMPFVTEWVTRRLRPAADAGAQTTQRRPKRSTP